jgi:hypothetical protein
MVHRGKDPSQAALWDALLADKCKLSWVPEVKQQLANWAQTGITLDQLDAYCVRRSLRISVVDGTVRAAHWEFANSGSGRAVCFLWLIQMVVLRANAMGR